VDDQTLKTRKVFLSYSWSGPAHEDRVEKFAGRLRGDGVDVVLDKWDLRYGQDINYFIEKMVNDATVTKVLVLIDHLYAEKADSRHGGVGKETQLISAEVYGRVEQTKFLPVLFERPQDGPPHLPAYLKSLRYFDFSTPERAEKEYPNLLSELFDKPANPKPPLGSPPAHLTDNVAQPKSSPSGDPNP
jgi:hypothetical protein